MSPVETAALVAGSRRLSFYYTWKWAMISCVSLRQHTLRRHIQACPQLAENFLDSNSRPASHAFQSIVVVVCLIVHVTV
eukprot:m.53106 g.53106  ORF g.53106 m.53106 type:complete len:79 (-) comp9139_c0_seq4:1012-1248(-)